MEGTQPPHRESLAPRENAFFSPSKPASAHATAAAGAPALARGGRLRTVIIISGYITCLFFKVLYKDQLINSLLGPRQVSWFFVYD